MKDIISDIIEKCSLINPCVTFKSQMLYESGEDLEDYEVAAYKKIGEKKLSELGINEKDTLSFQDDAKTLSVILENGFVHSFILYENIHSPIRIEKEGSKDQRKHVLNDIPEPSLKKTK